MFFAISSHHIIPTLLARFGYPFTSLFVRQSLIPWSLITTPSFGNDLPAFVFLDSRSTARNKRFLTDGQMLLHHCILDLLLAPRALDVSSILIACLTVNFKTRYRYLCRANRAFELAEGALIVVLFKIHVVWLLTATFISANKHQAL